MRSALAAAIFVTALAGASSAQPARRQASTSQCAPGETIVYSCSFGRKLASVCAASRRVTYRFGPLGRPEIAIASRPDWSNVHVGSVVGQQGGHQRHIRFSNGATHYIVFEGQDGQLADRPGRTYSGIAVVSGRRGEHEQATLSCKGRARIHPDFTGAVAARAPESRRDGLDEAQDGPFDAWF